MEPQHWRFCSFKLPGLCWSSFAKPWRYTNIANTSNSLYQQKRLGWIHRPHLLVNFVQCIFFFPLSLLLEERFVCWRLLGAGQECNACTDCAVFPVQLPLQTSALGKYPDPAAPALLKQQRNAAESKMLCFSQKMPFFKVNRHGMAVLWMYQCVAVAL